MTVLHRFHKDMSACLLPTRFTNPFHYKPDELVKQATSELMQWIDLHADWKEELSKGKMLGVLVVADADQQLGYLAAYSGNLLGRNDIEGFVPPIFDLLHPDGYFVQEEKVISDLNREIEHLQHSPGLRWAIACRTDNLQTMQQQLAHQKHVLKQSKACRDQQRTRSQNDSLLAQLERQSQFEKAEYKRLERRLKQQLLQSEQLVLAFEHEIELLKQERKKRSQALQAWLFHQYVIENAEGQTISLTDLFEQDPPAGAGECAGPKLLHYAYTHALHPISMGEFWWGASPIGEVRHHGLYYPSCQSKCRPILNFMLQGIQVEPIGSCADSQQTVELSILYEDSSICAVNKPAEQLSVPGKEGGLSVQEQLQLSHPQAAHWLAVHRLDMSTSGILLFAKSGEVYTYLQGQFAHRKVKKQYIALLSAHVAQKQGLINLPLCADLEDRPRQKVDYERGKPAITSFQVLNYSLAYTRVLFQPETGRTHQLRVHAAHLDGLNAPILGDRLYGAAAARLMLHASELSFKHPVSGEWMTIHSDPDF